VCELLISISLLLVESHLLVLNFNLYRPQSANSVDCDWSVASGSDCHLVQILTLHSSYSNGCD
jgi:hypothetical protein